MKTVHLPAAGNRILEIDIESMELVNTLDVPGLTGHHADNGFNSKIYSVPKDSGFVNVVDLRKDDNGNTTMENTTQIDLIHKPRSGDAFNKKFNVILMAAANRPMGSFINVKTDEVVGTIGEDVDCSLTIGGNLLDHADANTMEGATKYQCVNTDHGGDQISGHPYWLTPDYVAIVDRSNRQISVYNVWKEGDFLKSRLVNHLPTRTSVHQIVPRDRSSLPLSQQNDFYAVEEGNNGSSTNDYGIPHAIIKMRLTAEGLVLVSRIDLQRTQRTSKAQSERILQSCINIYRAGTPPNNTNATDALRTARYKQLFRNEGITANLNQVDDATFPVECFHAGIPGGHNGDFAPNNRDIYIGMAGGAMAIVDVDKWIIKNYVDVGIGTGPGHTCFSKKHDMAVITTHTASFVRVIDGINGSSPDMRFYRRYPITLNGVPVSPEGLTDTLQSHTCYIDENENFYYNFFTDGGVFFKMDLNTMDVVDSLYTGGVPIQGSYISLADIKPNYTIVSPECGMGADPQTVTEGEGTSFWWWADNATSATIDNGIGSVTVPDSYKWLNPTETTTYTMTAQGENGEETTCSTTITVKPVVTDPPTCGMGADPQTITVGQRTSFWWWADKTASATIDNGIGSATLPDSSKWLSPTETTTYTMTAQGENGEETTCSTTVTVNPVAASPSCGMGADPQTITAGEGTSFWWWADSVSSATIDNGIGAALFQTLSNG